MANCCGRRSLHKSDNAELAPGCLRNDGTSSLLFSDISSAGRIVGSHVKGTLGQQGSLLETCLGSEQLPELQNLASRLLARINGLSYPKPIEPVASAVTIDRRSMALAALRQYFITTSSERLIAGYTDSSCRLVAVEVLADGSPGAVSTEARSLFASALSLDARGIILAHNHPSGDPQPSHADVQATRRVKSMAEQLGIELIDHLIFVDGSAYSIRRGAMI